MNIIKSTGVAFLVILFTFGIFCFNNKFCPDNKQLSKEMILSKEALSHITLQKNEDKIVEVELKGELNYEVPIIFNDKYNGSEVPMVDDNNLNHHKESTNLCQQITNQDYYLQNYEMNTNYNTNTNTQSYVNQQPTYTEETKQINSFDNIIPQNINWRPNTSYLVCKDVLQLSPPENIYLPNDPNAPMFLTLLIPPDQTKDPNINEPENILEVTCNIQAMNSYPIYRGHTPIYSDNYPYTQNYI